MKPWLNEAQALLQGLLGPAESALETGILVAVALLVALVMMKVMGSATNNLHSALGSNALVLVLAVALPLAAAVAVRLYVFPKAPEDSTAHWATLGAAAAAFALVVAPAMSLLQRVKYLTALISLLVTGAVCALSVTGARTAYGAIHGGKGQMQQIEKRAKDVQETLSK
jgi:hypothetical protein